MFAGFPLPALLQFETEHQRIQSLVTENELLHKQLETTKLSLHETESNAQQLEAKLLGMLSQQAAATSYHKRAYTVGWTSKPATAVRSPHRKSLTHQGSAPLPSSVAQTSKANHSQESVGSAKNEPEEVETSLIDSPTIQEKVPNTSKEEAKKSTETMPARSIKDEPQRDDNTPIPNGGADDEQSSSSETESSQPFLVVVEQVYKSHVTPITHCEFSPNATYIASADVSGAVRVWEPTPSSGILTKAMSSYNSGLLSMEWVHHGSSDMLLMLGSGSGEVQLFDVAARQLFGNSLMKESSPGFFLWSAALQTIALPCLQQPLTIFLTPHQIPPDPLH